jgi:hypothetical protein
MKEFNYGSPSYFKCMFFVSLGVRLLSFLILFPFFFFAQTNVLADIPLSGKLHSDFVPKGWVIRSHESAKLNDDTLKDHILVLSVEREDTLSTHENPLKRIFILLVAQKDLTLKLSVKSENVICYYDYDQNFKDAFVGFRFEKNKFHVDHYGGFATRWGRRSTFTYFPNEKEWFLTQDEYTSFQATDPENTERTVIKTKKDFGTITLKNFNIYKEY